MYICKKTCLTLRIVFLHLSAVEVVDAIKASKDIQALCLEGNTIGVEAAKAIGEALSTRQEFEVKSKDCWGGNVFMKLTSMVVFLCTYHRKPLGGRGLWARGRDSTKEQKFWSKDGTAYVHQMLLKIPTQGQNTKLCTYLLITCDLNLQWISQTLPHETSWCVMHIVMPVRVFNRQWKQI